MYNAIVSVSVLRQVPVITRFSPYAACRRIARPAPTEARIKSAGRRFRVVGFSNVGALACVEGVARCATWSTSATADYRDKEPAAILAAETDGSTRLAGVVNRPRSRTSALIAAAGGADVDPSASAFVAAAHRKVHRVGRAHER